MPNFIICARNIKGQGTNKSFGDEPGEISYVVVPDEATDFTPDDKEKTDKAWLTKLLAGRDLDEVLIYLHGYNMSREVTLERHKVLKENMQKKGWKGELITFSWPSSKNTLLYWEDRLDGLDVAFQIVHKCIRLLSNQIENGCEIKVHVIAHSTGALLVREGFKIAKMAYGGRANWNVGQVVFIAGDISSDSMDSPESAALYERSGRITNYFSNYDSALMVSSAKRLGFANRVGRVGLPLSSADKAIDVNCSQHFKANEEKLKPLVKNAEFSHSWYFWSETFIEDLLYTLKGDLDRNVIPTRTTDQHGEFWLEE